MAMNRLGTLRDWQRLFERLLTGVPLLAALLPAPRAVAASLPEERSDALYHLYDGGGQKVQGPALLVRKNFAEKASLFAGYYVDQISGASIDVITNASPYHEERREISAGGAWLHRDTLLSLSYIQSDENDYEASTWRFGVAQDLFENRTTIALSYTRGDDTVGRVDSPMSEPASHSGYGLSLTQVLSPTLIGVLAFEGSADEGYLQNPYRAARLQGGSVPEVYPRTRTGQAVSVKLIKSWSDRWSTRIEGRYYGDTWDVGAANLGVESSHRIKNDLLLDLSYRYYHQSAASFYSDNFTTTLNYMARDKELASFNGHSLGGKLTVPLYRWNRGWLKSLDGSLAGYYLDFKYSDFSDLRTGKAYGFSAVVGQAFLTVRY